MAEREGFEPPVPFRVRRFSRPEPSTTRPPLHACSEKTKFHPRAVRTFVSLHDSADPTSRAMFPGPIPNLDYESNRAFALVAILSSHALPMRVDLCLRFDQMASMPFTSTLPAGAAHPPVALRDKRCDPPGAALRAKSSARRPTGFWQTNRFSNP